MSNKASNQATRENGEQDCEECLRLCQLLIRKEPGYGACLLSDFKCDTHLEELSDQLVNQ